jgi:hypothetical protein
MMAHERNSELKLRNPFPRCAVMDDEYRLAWADIEGWTTNAKNVERPNRKRICSKSLLHRSAPERPYQQKNCENPERDCN